MPRVRIVATIPLTSSLGTSNMSFRFRCISRKRPEAVQSRSTPPMIAAVSAVAVAEVITVPMVSATSLPATRSIASRISNWASARLPRNAPSTAIRIMSRGARANTVR
jgi:hypothetical protein